MREPTIHHCHRWDLAVITVAAADERQAGRADDRDIRRMDDRRLDLRQHPAQRQRGGEAGTPAAHHYCAADWLSEIARHATARQTLDVGIVAIGDRGCNQVQRTLRRSGSKASRRPSPRKLKAITINTIAAAGEANWSGPGVAFGHAGGGAGAEALHLVGDQGAELAGAALQPALDDDVGGGAHDRGVGCVERFADQHVDQAELVLEQQEDDPAGGLRALAADDEAGEADQLALGQMLEVARGGDAFAERGAEELHSGVHRARG